MPCGNAFGTLKQSADKQATAALLHNTQIQKIRSIWGDKKYAKNQSVDWI